METELRLCHAIYWFWFHRGYWSEGRGWFQDALERSAGEGRTKARGQAMAYDGMLAWIMGDHPAALAADLMTRVTASRVGYGAESDSDVAKVQVATGLCCNTLTGLS